MQITKQLCTFEQAKQFKALGITCESYFIFNKNGEPFGVPFEGWTAQLRNTAFYPALNVAELGAILKTKAGNCWCTDKEVWYCNVLPSRLYETQAECYADYLLFLLSHQRITIDEINKILQE